MEQLFPACLLFLEEILSHGHCFLHMITLQKKGLGLLWRSTSPVAVAVAVNKAGVTFLISVLCLLVEKRRNNGSVPVSLHMYD
jgi:hypothetical protein